jgi:hypothetical protein
MLLVPLLFLTACKIDLKGDSKKEKAQQCSRGLTSEIPAAFNTLGRPVGAVKTQSCDTIVVGADNAGETILARYDMNGQPLEIPGQGQVSHPLVTRYSHLRPRVQRLAMMNEGFFAIGYYGQTNEPRALLAFRFVDSGLLDNQFGPLNDGVVRGNRDPRFSLRQVDAPRVDQGRIVVRGHYEDQFTGTETERDEVFTFSAREAMAKDIGIVPVNCDMLNHQAFVDGTNYQFVQSTCGNLNLRTSGAFGYDNLMIVPNNTSYFSNVLGEVSFGYEGATPFMISRDGLGAVKKEYAGFVQGMTSLCGKSVDSRGRFLVFSTKRPSQPDWLTTCWFL